jgi:flagellar assembly protein FliH
MNKKPTRVIKATEKDGLDVWSLPKVQTESTSEEESHTNAFGQKTNWKYEPPEADIIAPEPLTAEDIEAIRQAAHEEGFTQGKEEGFTAGYEEGKAKGLTEGSAQGIEEGKSEGLTQGKEAIDLLSERWSSLIEQLNTPLATVEKNVEDQLLNLVVQLTEAVVLQEAKTNPDILIAAIATGIKALPANDENTQIYLHPDDIKHVEQQFGEQHIKDSGWKLLPAPQLTVGSCQIENSTSNIDLQMKSRLKQVLESFLQDALHQS